MLFHTPHLSDEDIAVVRRIDQVRDALRYQLRW